MRMEESKIHTIYELKFGRLIIDSFDLTPLREFIMLEMINALTDKDKWEEKVSSQQKSIPHRKLVSVIVV